MDSPFFKILMAIFCLFLVWRMYTSLKANPELLSRENLSKSFGAMGILALILIGGVALMIMLLRAG